MKNLVIAMTGASGSVYGIRLLQVLLSSGHHVHLTMSPSAVDVLQHEMGLRVRLTEFRIEQLLPEDLEFAGRPLWTSRPADLAAQLMYHHYQDFHAGIASGSFQTDGMVICPCSMGTLSGVANGLSSNLIQRAADVHLKERRKLIVVPRETPLSSIPLENMKRLADAGAVVLPAMPGFYGQPTHLLDVVDFIVGRICDQFDVKHDLVRRWGKN